MALNNENLNKIKNLNYIPVGLRNTNFSNEWLRDNVGENISKKNPYYGEYTFYYWYWKNLLKDKEKNDWVGFCSYRELWGNKNNSKNKNLNSILLQELPKEWEKFDVIIGEPMSLKKTKIIKLIKYGKLALIRNPKDIFRPNHTIRFHFDMFHGVGNLDKAINLLPKKDRNDFYKYVRNETSINQGNMFIAKSEKVIDAYFSEIFSWLENCEKLFGFHLEGYSKIRMYTFLAERFLPYWFKKYTKYLEWPVVYCDINKR